MSEENAIESEWKSPSKELPSMDVTVLIESSDFQGVFWMEAFRKAYKEPPIREKKRHKKWKQKQWRWCRRTEMGERPLGEVVERWRYIKGGQK